AQWGANRYKDCNTCKMRPPLASSERPLVRKASGFAMMRSGVRLSSAPLVVTLAEPVSYGNDCSRDLSREHFVSAALLRSIEAFGPLRVGGLAWLGGEE